MYFLSIPHLRTVVLVVGVFMMFLVPLCILVYSTLTICSTSSCCLYAATSIGIILDSLCILAYRPLTLLLLVFGVPMMILV